MNFFLRQFVIGLSRSCDREGLTLKPILYKNLDCLLRMKQKGVILLVLLYVICLQAVATTALSCHKYYKTSIKPADLPKDTDKVSCSSPDDACEVRVTRLKTSKHILSVELKCNTMVNCKGTGQECKSITNDQESCGHCCQTDNCNKPELAKFESNLAHKSHIDGLLSLIVLLASIYCAVY